MDSMIVTGGAGFIGSNFLYYMRERHPGLRLICVDSLTYAGNIETLSGFKGDGDFRFVKASICDRDAMDALFSEEKPEYVVNFAAESHVDRSILNPQVFLETNVIGTSVMLDMARRHECRRFHQVSTDEVYGDLPLDRPDLLFKEDTPLHASSPYSASKASADLVAMAYARTYGTPVTISRCSNNYGPYQFPEKLIPLMISKALRGERLPVYGDGLNVRDWLYVRDHCKAIDLILRDAEDGSVYNVGGHNERANIDIVKTILRELDCSEGLISFVEDRKGHDRRYAIDPTRIGRDLGWKPETCFEDGIGMTIRWYLENREWSDRILDGSYLESNGKVRQ